MPRSRPSYPPEFKEEVVRLVRSSDAQWPIPKIACDLGVAPETLRNWVRQAEKETLKKRPPNQRPGRESPTPQVIYGFIEAEKASHSIGTLCRILKVSKSGYYAWRIRTPPEKRARADALCSPNT